MDTCRLERHDHVLQVQESKSTTQQHEAQSGREGARRPPPLALRKPSSHPLRRTPLARLRAAWIVPSQALSAPPERRRALRSLAPIHILGSGDTAKLIASFISISDPERPVFFLSEAETEKHPLRSQKWISTLNHPAATPSPLHPRPNIRHLIVTTKPNAVAEAFRAVQDNLHSTAHIMFVDNPGLGQFQSPPLPGTDLSA